MAFRARVRVAYPTWVMSASINSTGWVALNSCMPRKYALRAVLVLDFVEFEKKEALTVARASN